MNECTGTSSAALKLCAEGPTLQGLDVSYYEQTINWTNVKAAGQSFVFIRVADGVDHPDTKFAQNWPGAKAVGLMRGAYQFFRPAKDVDAQVDLFTSKIDAAGGLQPGDLPPVLDLESDGGLASATVVARAHQWLDKVEAKYGVKPIVYTAAYMTSVVGTTFGNYILWVANYQTTCPSMPDGWDRWAFWQNSEKGSVNGVPTEVDTNLFNGTLPELNALTIKGAPVVTPKATVDAVNAVVDDTAFSGYQGETIGSSDHPKAPESAPFNPCR